MSTYSIHTPFHPRDLISDRAARRAAAHPRIVVRRPAPVPVDATSAGPARPDTAGNPQILRRWSVAELIATAIRPGEAA